MAFYGIAAKVTPATNRKLRDTTWRAITASTTTNITMGGSQGALANISWYSVSGTSWISDFRQGTTNLVQPAGGYYARPYFQFYSGSGTVNEPTVAYNYGWDLGDVMYGFSTYGTNFNNGISGTALFNGYTTGTVYNIRQVLYNATKNEMAVRASTAAASVGDLFRLLVTKTSSADFSLGAVWAAYGTPAPNNYKRFYTMDPGNGDKTGVWILTGTGVYSSWGAGLEPNTNYYVSLDFNASYSNNL